MSIPSWTSPRASDRTLPISRVIARARRSLCSAISAPNAYRISPRFGAGRPLPHRPRRPGRTDRHRDVGRRALLEPPDHVAGVGRVAALERRAGGGIAPLAGDEVAERRDLGRRGCGRSLRGLGHAGIVARFRPVRRPPRPSRRHRGTGSRGHSGLRGVRARGAASRRSAPRSPRSGGRGRSRHR